MPIDAGLLEQIKENKFRKESLILMEQDITDKDLEKLVEYLNYNMHIKELNLSHNNISNKGAETLARARNLLKLNISSNNIGPEGAKALAKSNLKSLDISANPIGDAVGEFSQSSDLQELIASECNITTEGANGLFLSSSIIKLDLSSNEVIDGSLNNIAANKILKDLNLCQNRLSEEAIRDVCTNNSLICLNLTNVFISPKAVFYLANNKSLRELILIQCFIEDISAFGHNCTLEKLILSNNHIKNIGDLSKNTSLFHLNLRSNPIGEEIERSLEACYYDNSSQVFTRTPDFIKELTEKQSERSSSESERKTLAESLGDSAPPLTFSKRPSSPVDSPEAAKKEAHLLYHDLYAKHGEKGKDFIYRILKESLKIAEKDELQPKEKQRRLTPPSSPVVESVR